MRGDANLAGSKSVARYPRVNIGTRETHDVPVRVWATKSLSNGKAVQMASWESDQLVVVLKQGNACGAKGLAGEPWSRGTSSGHRTGPRKSTKLYSMTYSTEGEEVFLKSRMREICTSGSVRGLVVNAARWWPPALLDHITDISTPPRGGFSLKSRPNSARMPRAHLRNGKHLSPKSETQTKPKARNPKS